MNRRTGLIIVLLLLLIGAVAWIVFKLRHDGDQSELTLYGNVDIREVDLGFRVLGKLQTLNIEEGDLVIPGQFIGSLEKTPYVDELRQAQARVKAAKVAFENAEKVFKRREELIGPEAVSQEEFDNAMATLNQNKANYEEAEAALASSTTRLTDTEVYSPSHGTVLTRVREPGAIVKVGDPVCTVSLTAPVQIRAYVMAKDLGRIYPGMPATIITDTPNSPVYKGHIGFISSVAEFTPKTVETVDLRTDLVFRLRIIVDNADRYLRQGMPVTITLATKR